MSNGKQAVSITDLPPEVLSRTFELLVQCYFHQLVFHSRPPKALKDLICVSHVNSLFRNVAINNPYLWTNFPSLNFNSREFLHTVLTRSNPYPFALSFHENDTFLPGLLWPVVSEHVARLRFLCVEVNEIMEGFWAKAVLGVTLPTIEQCIIKYHGFRNVCLDHPFSLHHTTPLALRTLDLTNCYASPPFGISTPIEAFHIRYDNSFEPPRPSIPLGGCSLWNAQFASLHHLTLSNCVSPEDVRAGDRLELPSLQTLVVVTPFRLCKVLACKLQYPVGCSMRITLTFPGTMSLDDAEIAGTAAAAFILEGETFSQCYLFLNPDAPVVQFKRASNRSVVFAFHLCQPTIVFGSLAGAAIRAVNVLTFYLPPLTPAGLFTFSLWDTFATALVKYTADVLSLHVIFPEHKTDTSLLPPMLTIMPRIQSLSIYPPTIYASYTFDWAMQRSYDFSQLRQVLVKLVDQEAVGAVADGLAGFLHRQLHRGTPIREVLFVVSPLLLGSMGYAGEQGLRSMLVDMAIGFPLSISVDWVEKARL